MLARAERRPLDLGHDALRRAVGDVLRELGLVPIPVPGGVVQSAARTLVSLPTARFAPPSAEWIEAVSHPSIMDTRKAKRELGWQPRHTAVEAVRETARRGP